MAKTATKTNARGKRIVKASKQAVEIAKSEAKPRAKRNSAKFGLRFYWKSHFDPTKERASTTWHKTETERDKALGDALKDKRPDGTPRYTNIKKVERD